MTRTLLQRILQRNDSDLLSYDFADSRPSWETWWFRLAVATAGICSIWFFWPLPG